MDKAFYFQEDRLELKNDLWDTLKKKLNPAKAAKFIQLENQIQLLIDLRISAELPLIEKTAVDKWDWLVKELHGESLTCLQVSDDFLSFCLELIITAFSREPLL